MAELMICSVCGRMTFSNVKKAREWRMMFFVNQVHFICPRHYENMKVDDSSRQNRKVLIDLTRHYLMWSLRK